MQRSPILNYFHRRFVVGTEETLKKYFTLIASVIIGPAHERSEDRQIKGYAFIEFKRRRLPKVMRHCDGKIAMAGQCASISQKKNRREPITSCM